MPFQKKHKNRYTTCREKPLTSSPVCLRMDEELAKDLKSVSDWQERLRLALPELIKNWKAPL
ncbi:hypothetical protein [Pelatocladus sp. BLCC-F211]|uniref:hypothetical protein n=1 Tax=Pelatocladus sp. BLCC-F211 TaxID=3342752 RepID=UPI0035BBF772